jgi:hypothetical protein
MAATELLLSVEALPSLVPIRAADISAHDERSACLYLPENKIEIYKLCNLRFL